MRRELGRVHPQGTQLCERTDLRMEGGGSDVENNRQLHASTIPCSSSSPYHILMYIGSFSIRDREEGASSLCL